MTQVNFYSKEQIDEREIGEPTDSASSTGSLWARIKNAVARIVSLETADTNNVKKTGTSTVTGTLQVPTTPPTPTSVVNSVYVNDATEGVNNLMHKTAREKFYGIKEGMDNIYGTSWCGVMIPPRVGSEKFYKILKAKFDASMVAHITGMSRIATFDLTVGGQMGTLIVEVKNFVRSINAIRVFLANDSEYFYILISDYDSRGGSRMKVNIDYFEPLSVTNPSDSVMRFAVIGATPENEPTVTPGGYTHVLEVLP